jgi:TolA-binding protein
VTEESGLEQLNVCVCVLHAASRGGDRDAERRYGAIVGRYGDTAAAPEAIYWRGVSHYKASNDHTMLGVVARELKARYPQSVWTVKASVWAA